MDRTELQSKSEIRPSPSQTHFFVTQLEYLVDCCDRSHIGKRLPTVLYVHISALTDLDPRLQDYESTTRPYLKTTQGITLVKFSTDQPQITYLIYPDFDTDPHPALHASMQIDLRDLHVRYRDYDASDNPPLLHQKNLLLTPDYPLYEKFAKLTQQEEDWGLLDNIGAIFDCQGWEKCLNEHCAVLKGHRVIWQKDADPYHVKVIRSSIRQRQAKRREAEEYARHRQD